MIVALLLSLIILGGIVAIKSTTMQKVFTCASEQSMLVYPLYDKRGTVTDYRKFCGTPHRGCTRRSDTSSIYDCSPFMAPDTLWAGGGLMVN